jgi:sec-independent protein translocase protein TatB
MFENLSGWHILVVLLIGLFVFGPDKLPAAIRDGLRFVRTARRMLADASEAVRDQVDPDLAADLAEVRGIAAAARLRPPSLAQLLLDDDRPGPLGDIPPSRQTHRPGAESATAALTTAASTLSAGTAGSRTQPAPDSPPAYLDAT